MLAAFGCSEAQEARDVIALGRFQKKTHDFSGLLSAQRIPLVGLGKIMQE